MGRGGLALTGFCWIRELADVISEHSLYDKIAGMAGKEAGLYVPSGTMGNLICVLAHCWERGAELLLGDR